MVMHLHCEGKTDYAVISTLMKKVVENQELSVNWVKRDDLKKWITHRKQTFKISGSYKMIAALAAIAFKFGNKNIAFHQDADRKYVERYNAITAEFAKLQKFNCLAIVPKEMIESWLLADANAYPQEPKNPSLPAKPEELWGLKGSENHPKKYLENVLKQYHQTPSAEIFSQLIEKSNLEILKKRCPKSFGQFYVDLQTFIAKAGAAP